MEDRLRSLGILGNKDDHASKTAINSLVIGGIDLDANLSEKKVSILVDGKWELYLLPISRVFEIGLTLHLVMLTFCLLYQLRAAVMSMAPSKACEVLERLVNMWQSRFH